VKAARDVPCGAFIGFSNMGPKNKVWGLMLRELTNIKQEENLFFLKLTFLYCITLFTSFLKMPNPFTRVIKRNCI
jgi:hypothetical protein